MDATTDEFTRFRACLLGLMNADLKVRPAGETRDRCAAAADELRRSLQWAGLEYKPGSRRELLIEKYDRLLSVVAIGDLEQTLALLVELVHARRGRRSRAGPSSTSAAASNSLDNLPSTYLATATRTTSNTSTSI